MNGARYCMVTMRRGKKRALLLTTNGGLFVDTLNGEMGAAIQTQLALGWEEADIKYFYPGDKHGGDVILAAAAHAVHEDRKQHQQDQG